MSGKLIVVPTPIGNLEDMTLRAVKVLNEVDIILSEDTRKTSILTHHFQIKTKLESFHKFNEHKHVERIIDRLKAGEKIALVSDAGTPAISDPGYLLVKHCVDNEIDIECLPGATALIPAIVLSGLPNDKFVFEGFLPQKKGRQKRFKELAEETRTMVFYESPFRLMKLLEQIQEFFGEERRVSVSRELTKIYEETIRGTVVEVIAYYKSNTIKGELVIVVEGKKE